MTAALALAVIAGAGAGCTAMPSPFDGERSNADELPAIVPPMEGADAASSRYQGQSSGYDVYLLKGKPPSQICLVVTAGTADTTLTSCSGGSWLQTTVSDGTAFRVQLQGFDGDPDPTGTEVSPWVHDVTGIDEG
ncbi:hypothetical protein ACFVU2_05695 [Leifsonia sp. NPDC058194]|uniref:hypothetical protein n=1 Tax=Leifsonia sp. NPDC058194 TaxID=3346374 RepID=UPI0036DF0FFA